MLLRLQPSRPRPLPADLPWSQTIRCPRRWPHRAAPHDWSGFYVGLSYGRTASSEIVDTTLGPVYRLSKGSVSVLNLGYLAQRNQFVFGGELSYLNYNDVIMAGLAGYHMDKTIDLKGRLGVAANKDLFYGALGYSTGTFTVDPLAASYKPKGASYGLGVEYAATQRLIIGVEYLARKMQADGPTALVSDIDVNLNTLSLRVGLSL